MDVWISIGAVVVLNILYLFVPEDLEDAVNKMSHGLVQAAATVIIVHFAVKWW